MVKIDEILTRGVDKIIVKDSLKARLQSNKKLTVKLGIDPTGAELHLGHAVVLRKLREFQDLDHQIVLVIGDFTAKVGDPSGRTMERRFLTSEQIKKNMETYKEQVGKILDLKKVKFKYNSIWFNKIDLKGFLELTSKATLAQISKRKEFKARSESGKDIPVLEMLYPLMQGYDSVELKADVELSGVDQELNLQMGRQIQKRYGQKSQDLVIMRLLPGTDNAKMSQSANNYISLTADPFDMYGKIMSISDELLPEYYELCTNISLRDVRSIKTTVKEGGPEVFKLKKKLAKTIVELYHTNQAAEQAESNFEKVHQKGEYDKIQVYQATILAGSYYPEDIPIASGTTTSTVHAKKLIQEGAVEMNGEKITDLSQKIELKPGNILRIGKKRFVKVKK